jgi:hypothetical protein
MRKAETKDDCSIERRYAELTGLAAESTQQNPVLNKDSQSFVGIMGDGNQPLDTLDERIL